MSDLCLSARTSVHGPSHCESSSTGITAKVHVSSADNQFPFFNIVPQTEKIDADFSERVKVCEFVGDIRIPKRVTGW